MNRLQKFVTKNAGVKLLSLALAVALWAAVGSDPVTEASFRIPLEFINVPANLELLTEQPSVQLWARGPSHVVRRATTGDFAIRVNVAPISGTGEHTFSLDPSGVVAPTPLRVVELIPSEVRVTLEENLIKEVPIAPRFSGIPAPGFRVKVFHLEPSQARITGPGSHVRAISAASTDAVDVTNLASGKTFLTNVYVPDPLVRFLRARAVMVTVVVERIKAPDSSGTANPAH